MAGASSVKHKWFWFSILPTDWRVNLEVYIRKHAADQADVLRETYLKDLHSRAAFGGAVVIALLVCFGTVASCWPTTSSPVAQPATQTDSMSRREAEEAVLRSPTGWQAALKSDADIQQASREWLKRA